MRGADYEGGVNIRAARAGAERFTIRKGTTCFSHTVRTYHEFGSHKANLFLDILRAAVRVPDEAKFWPDLEGLTV
jgi:hypothetical protein